MDPLDDLAASVSDRGNVDWPDVEPEEDGVRRRMAALRNISRIAAFNRSLQRAGDSNRAPSGALAIAVPESAVRWGDLALLEKVGAGTSGEVWRAWDVRLQREVALKFPLEQSPPAQRSSSAAGSPLLAEARALARLRHPGVVAVYGISEHNGRLGMWMELLRGETLAEAIERGGPIPCLDVARLGSELARALAAVHAVGLVHRDIKPANIVLESGGRVVLTDFSLGQDRGLGRSASGRVAGTPMFLAPELFAGEPSSARSDLYALGVTLRFALTGRPPFTAESIAELSEQAKRGLSTPLLDERPDAPAPLATAIERAMATDPEARFGTATALADELAGVLPSPQGTVAAGPVARHSLPAERDAFVGRMAEVEELRETFEAGARLVTLVGAGGMGKTRLAVRYGWQSAESWPGGVWFCDLTEARDLNGIVTAVAGSLGISLDRDPITLLGHVIARRGRCLMILDNFEQVAPFARESVERWLDRAAEARFLVTSRERLHVQGEAAQTLDPLNRDAGAELFIERARRQGTRFQPQSAEFEAVREVVRLTEGMPLAIELAAARVRMMGVGEVAARMRERFRLLGGGGSGRHANLKAVIDGSWEALAEWEKAAWAQCAVFEGGFTLAAAEGVLDLSDWPEAPWVVDVVQALVDKSLLRAWVPEPGLTEAAPAARFGMYVTLHEFAGAKLQEEGAIGSGRSGPAAKRAAEERHGRWFQQFATEVNREIVPRRFGMMRGQDRDLENLMAACHRALVRGDVPVAVETYRAASAVLSLRGPMGRAREMGLELLGALPLDLPDKAEILTLIGQGEWFGGQLNEARARFENVLAIHRETGDASQEAAVLDFLGSICRAQGRVDEALAYYEAALAISRKAGDRVTEGVALGNLGIVHREQGRLDEALAHYEEALAIHREVGNRGSEGIALSNLGNLLRVQGRLEEARVQHEAALAIHREIGSRRSEGHVLGSLGNVTSDLGRADEARAYYEAALATHREFGDRRFEGVVLGYLGHLDATRGHVESAVAHYEAALAITREVGSRRFECSLLAELGELERERGRSEAAHAWFESGLTIASEIGNRPAEGALLGSLGNLLRQDGRFDEALAALTRGEALLRQVGAKPDLGKLLCARAMLEQDRGAEEAARARLAEAESLVIETGSGPSSELGKAVAKLRRTLGVSV
jgi:predicted ATPase